MPTLLARPTSSRVVPWGLGIVLPLALACAGDHLYQPPIKEPDDQLFWSLEVNHPAVTLSTTAPYDTATIVATPRNAKGESLNGLPTPQYSSSDPELVAVSPQGVLVARGSTGTTLIQVVATLTANNLRHADTVVVRVVDDPAPPVLKTFSIHPVPPDSAKTAIVDLNQAGSNSYRLTHLVRASDMVDAPLTDLLVSFRSSDALTALIHYQTDGGVYAAYLAGKRAGTVTLSASTTLFGVTKADTLPFRIGWPILGFVSVEPITTGSLTNTFVQPAVTVGTGAAVFWGNNSTTALATTDIAFTDPTNVAAFSTFTGISASADHGGMTQETFDLFCFLLDFFGTGCNSGGNMILPLPYPDFSFANQFMAGRVFSVPGTYEYHSTIHGASGRVIVVDER